ncbi:trehalose-phosphatase [Corynebacterium sp. NML 150383]|uniref:trehalose-phosphatase n=1 Tax=Corynebacterium sp. NML 150383 TaxID=2029400 RepID=UPI000BAA4D5B|nr:trehalose-phosphatase [Corynebacterium sp. NML 150383]PAT03080.1 trehalose-phosphatase [Corynebacterium sp. NML 150383]
MATLTAATERAAHAESLLVCLDFDGTLAEFNADPYAVAPHPAAVDALRTLAALPHTQVAILSGRHLDGLRRVLPEIAGNVVLAGSHGAEPGPELSSDDAAYLDRIGAALERIAAAPAYVEVKPYQRVLHVAPIAGTPDAERMLAAARSLDTGGRPVTPGHNVVEFSAVEITKGTWLSQHKREFAATLFAGDDTTDETALRVLDPRRDVGIKVGDQPSVAAHRVADVPAMAQVLSELARARSARAGTASAE